MPKNVREVIKVARRNGSSNRKKYQAKYDMHEKVLSLFHYNTLIFKARKAGGMWRIQKLGGYSTSDKDAIHEAFDYCEIPGKISASKKNIEDDSLQNIDGWAVIGIPSWALRDRLIESI